MKHAFSVRGISYTLAVLDEPEMGTADPTLLLFRGLEEEAFVTVHLDPDCECQEGHLVLPPMEETLGL